MFVGRRTVWSPWSGFVAVIWLVVAAIEGTFMMPGNTANRVSSAVLTPLMLFAAWRFARARVGRTEDGVFLYGAGRRKPIPRGAVLELGEGETNEGWSTIVPRYRDEGGAEVEILPLALFGWTTRSRAAAARAVATVNDWLAEPAAPAIQPAETN
ncbi:hypothetical protein ACFT5B_08725 [Luteimicrobium sp. NPDC057192]|uniref:hypothetical protein n=1 Tax=Luteimicrobium sp. NPDC057192 TaxID=3346042 RepID=UPI00363B75C1